jgi:hypothetical protein
VANHIDYRTDTQTSLHTIWFFTHPTGIWIKGEGLTDKQAVLICAKAAAEFAGVLEEE